MRVKCRSPLCDRELRRDNKSGFCRACTRGGPSRRWFDMSDPSRRARRLAQGVKYNLTRRNKLTPQRACSGCEGVCRGQSGLCRKCWGMKVLRERAGREALRQIDAEEHR